MHYHWQTLERSCKVSLNLKKFFQKTHQFRKYFAKVVFSLNESCWQGFCCGTKSNRYFSKFRAFPCENVERKCRFKNKRFALVQVKTTMILSKKNKKKRDKVTLVKNCFILYFCSDELYHYKTYFSESSFILMFRNVQQV